MIKSTKKVIPLFYILLVILFILAINNIQSQSKGKPPKPPKCDYDGLCEEREGNDCPDCQQQQSLPLELDHVMDQIITGSAINDKKVYQIKYVNGEYKNAWYSSVNEGFTYATSIGDVDNDGYNEITTVVSYKKSKGPPSGRISYQKIFVYEDGSTGDPDYTSHDLGYSLNGVRDSIIADADNDGQNEIVLVVNKHLEIFRWNGTGFSNLWNSQEYEQFIWSVDVGDSDNDGDNEIVLAMFGMGSAIVYEYLENNTWGNPVTTESIGSHNIDIAKVRDADNDGLNEIIGGGTSNRLNVWKYIDGYYVNVFLSEELGGFTQGIDAGDVDGDGLKEIIVGTASDTSVIYVFKYYQTYLEVVDSIPVDGVVKISLGDVDHDGVEEIVAGTDGITVFKFLNGILSFVYNFPRGGYLEIG